MPVRSVYLESYQARSILPTKMPNKIKEYFILINYILFRKHQETALIIILIINKNDNNNNNNNNKVKRMLLDSGYNKK